MDYRKGELLMKEYGFGVDLGGTTCKIGLFRTDGELIEKWEIPTDTAEEGARILPDIAASIDEKLREKGISKDDVQGVGIGVPGAVRPDGVVNRCVNLGWGVRPLEKEFGELSGLKVKAANDANIAALGEAWMGGGRDASSVVMITLGTGIGGGIIIDGQILTGFNGAAGEIGHVVLDPDETRKCNCGNFGCAELYGSATGIAYLASQALLSSDKPSALREIADPTAKDVFDALKAGDELAGDIVDEVCGYLGRLCAIITNIVNPEIILIGGGVSKAGNILIERLQPAFSKTVFHASAETKMALAELGNDAGIYGGVRLIL